MQIRALGPLEVELDGNLVNLGGYKQSLVLGLLVLGANRVVPVSTIIDGLWGDEPNDRAASTVQVYISNLRKLFEPHTRARGRDLIVTQRPGYLLAADEDELDLLRLERLLAAATAAERANDLRGAVDHLRAALALWRGEALAGLADNDEIRGSAIRLDNQRMASIESCVAHELDLGEHTRVLGELQSLVEKHPLNERLCGLLMLAQYRSGRQADALSTFQAARERLLDALGIDPSPELRSLEHRILVQDASLALGAPVSDEGATMIRSHVAVPVAELRAGDKHVAIMRPVTTIGRRADRDLVLDDADVSRCHAEIHLTADGFVLRDVGSTNGTHVDGRAVREHLLADGTAFVVGSTTVHFRLGPP